VATQTFRTEDFVAGHYSADQLVIAGPGRRLAAYSLELLAIFIGFASFGLLLIPYFIWFIIAANNGQTPGKQLLGMYVIQGDGTRAGGGHIWLRELIFKGLLLNLLTFITLGIFFIVAALWCLWDKDNQTLWDKIGSTYVAWSPNGFKPLTANEIRMGAPAPQRTPGSGLAASGVSTAEQLRELARLRDESLITDDEYESRRKELVEEL
jgi:uncharacterized RDD family membrane protein YckC